MVFLWLASAAGTAVINEVVKITIEWMRGRYRREENSNPKRILIVLYGRDEGRVSEVIELEAETRPDGARLHRILTPVLDIVVKRDPGMPTLLIDRDRRGWKVRVRERPDRDGDLLFIPFLDVEDR